MNLEIIYSNHFLERATERQINFNKKQLEKNIKKYVNNANDKWLNKNLIIKGKKYLFKTKFNLVILLTCVPVKNKNDQKLKLYKNLKIGESKECYKFNEKFEIEKHYITKIDNDYIKLLDKEWFIHGELPKVFFDIKKIEKEKMLKSKIEINNKIFILRKNMINLKKEIKLNKKKLKNIK